jgi:hypothetical protein
MGVTFQKLISIFSRGLLLVVCLLALSVGASATSMSVQQQTLTGVQFPGLSTSNPLHVRIYYSKSFTPSDNSGYIVAGAPVGPLVANAYKDLTCSLVGGSWVVPAFAIESTDDGQDDTTSLVSFYYFTSGGGYIGPVQGMTSLVVYHQYATRVNPPCSPLGTCAFWLDLRSSSQGVPIPTLPTWTYPGPQIDQKFIAAITAAGAPASAPYLIKSPVSQLTNAEALNALTPSSIVKTDPGGSGSLVAAVPGTDYLTGLTPIPPVVVSGTTISLSGLSSVGSPNQIPGVNVGGTAWEYKAVSATLPVTVTPGAGTLAFACPTCEVTGHKDAVSGYAGLDGSGLLKTAEFPIVPVTVGGLGQNPSGSANGSIPMWNNGTSSWNIGLISAGNNISVTPSAGGIQIGLSSLPNPSPSTLGGVESATAPSHQWFNSLSNLGVLSASQPGFSDINGTAAVNQGGTGQTSYTDGQILIGDTSTGGLDKASLTAGSNITITPGHGSVTIAAVVNPPWSALGNATGNLNLNNGTNTTQVMGSGNLGTSPWFELLDQGGDTGTGALLRVRTVSPSTEIPIQIFAQGTTNGSHVDGNGIWRADGTGGFDASALVTGTVNTNQLPNTVVYSGVSSPELLGLGIGQAAPAITAAGITGASISTQASLSVAVVQAGGNYIPNDILVKTFYDTLLSPVLNPGTGNANKSLTIFNVDYSLSSGLMTGFSVNLEQLRANGTPEWTVSNLGNATLANNLTVGGALSVTGNATVTGSITVSSCTGCGGGGANAVLNNQSNVYSTGLQNFAAATMTLPTGAGLDPTVSAQIAYDSNTNRVGIGVNGSYSPLTTAVSIDTFTNKTLNTSGSGNVFQVAGTQITALSGNTGVLATFNGTYTNGDCVSIDGSGNVKDAGVGACSGTAGTSVSIQNLLNPTSANTSINMSTWILGFQWGDQHGASSFTEQYGALTTSPSLAQHSVFDTTGNTNGGYIEEVHSVIGSSTVKPFGVHAQGTTIGWHTDTNGLIQADSTGGVATGALVGTVSTTNLPSTIVYNNQANTISTGLQNFAAATLKVPASASYAPTTSALFGYDTSANQFVGGVNGSKQTFPMLEASNTFISANTFTLPTNGNTLKIGPSTTLLTFDPYQGTPVLSGYAQIYYQPTFSDVGAGGSVGSTVGFMNWPQRGTLTATATRFLQAYGCKQGDTGAAIASGTKGVFSCYEIDNLVSAQNTGDGSEEDHGIGFTGTMQGTLGERIFAGILTANTSTNHIEGFVTNLVQNSTMDSTGSWNYLAWSQGSNNVNAGFACGRGGAANAGFNACFDANGNSVVGATALTFATSSGSLTGWQWTGSTSGQGLQLVSGTPSASSETIDLAYNTRTLTITAPYTTQRFVLLNAPTITSSSSNTIGNASTFTIAGAPTTAGSAVLTTAYAMWVESGTSLFGGNVAMCGACTLGAGVGGVPDVALSRPAAGTFKITNASTGVGALGSAKIFATKTSNYSVLNTDTDTVFSNAGASGAVSFTLPTPAAGLTYTFVVEAAHNLTVTLAGGATLRFGATTGTTQDVNATVGGVLKIVATSTSTWVVVYSIGTWTLT